MTTATDLTKAEAARLEKLTAYAAGLTLPNATISVGVSRGVRLFVRWHDVYGTTYDGERYVAKHGYSDSHLIGYVDDTLATLKRNLAAKVKAL